MSPSDLQKYLKMTSNKALMLYAGIVLVGISFFLWMMVS